MALFTGANYKVGFQGYMKFSDQGARLVLPHTITSPGEQAAATLVGPCQLPGWNRNDNFRPVEGIGSAKDLAQVPGRRECDFRTQLLVADGTILQRAIRTHAIPGTAGTAKGLRLMTVEIGTDSDYDDQYAIQSLDSLFSSLRLEYAENQMLTADMEFWCTAFVDATPDASVGAPASDVLLWQYLTWTVGVTDYKPILSRVSVSVNNTLERVGSRNQIGELGSEDPISRTPYSIVPKMEKLQVQYGLHDDLPTDLVDSDDWGTVTLYAATPDGTRDLTIEIEASYLNRRGQGQTGANNMLTFTADTASHGITITPGP